VTGPVNRSYWTTHWPAEHTALFAVHGSAKQRTPGPEHVGRLSLLASARQSQPVQ
jgi:hypothetical protein